MIIKVKVELIEQKPELALALKRRASMETLKPIIDEGYDILQNYLSGLGKQPSGTPYIAYLGMGEEFDMEVGFPISEELPVKGDLYMSKTCSGPAATGTHKGSYDRLEQAYGEIFKYMEENSLEPTGVYYDYYINDPSVTPEDELLTKIVIPVK